MNKGLEVARGKTKVLYEKPGQADVLVVQALDAITAGDGARRDEIAGKGRLAVKTAGRVFRLLNLCGLPTHYLSGGEDDDDNEMLVRRCTMVPLEVVVRGVAAGSLVRRKPGIARGSIIVPRMVEFFLKDDANHDPLIEPDEIVARGLASPPEIGAMSEIGRIAFEILAHAWRRREALLVDLKLEFGRLQSGEGRGNLVIADTVDNDSWRVWPQGREDLMLDKQMYRNLETVTPARPRTRSAQLRTRRRLGRLVSERSSCDGRADRRRCRFARGFSIRSCGSCKSSGLQTLRRVVSTHLVPGYVLASGATARCEFRAACLRRVGAASGRDAGGSDADTGVRCDGIRRRTNSRSSLRRRLRSTIRSRSAAFCSYKPTRARRCYTRTRSSTRRRPPGNAWLNDVGQTSRRRAAVTPIDAWRFSISTTLPLSRNTAQQRLGARASAKLRRIAAALQRDPTLVEAHAFAAQWSEHCSYKSSRRHLQRLPTEGPTRRAGAGRGCRHRALGEWQGKRYGIVVAHESHNHPSQVVPFEGAATGIGGIVRDVLCMGARVIALADPLRFGPLDEPHCRYVAQGVVDGIAAYGNAIGVPTIAGDVYVHPGFRDNVLVNVVALGLVEEDAIVHSARAAGFRRAGTSCSSEKRPTAAASAAQRSLRSSLDADDAEQNKGAVQVPDPFLKTCIMRASYRVFDVLRERGIAVGFKDLGAGGIMG